MPQRALSGANGRVSPLTFQLAVLHRHALSPLEVLTLSRQAEPTSPQPADSIHVRTQQVAVIRGDEYGAFFQLRIQLP